MKLNFLVQLHFKTRRYLLFTENHYMQEYLDEMGKLGRHAGFVGYGEHYNNRFVNQSMTCVVFE